MFKFKRSRKKYKSWSFCKLVNVRPQVVFGLIRHHRAYKLDCGEYVRMGFTKSGEVYRLLDAGLLYVKLGSY